MRSENKVWEAITALVALATMIWTIIYSNNVFEAANKQYQENLITSRKQYSNDSILYEKQLLLLEKQISLSIHEIQINQEPIIKILPEDIVGGGVGKFELSIKNFGISKLTDIQIYPDYFVALTPPESQTMLIRIGRSSSLPTYRIPIINSKEVKYFKIDFEETYNHMIKFYTSKETKGQRMMVARFIIRFMRQIDGKTFEYSKAFVIAGNGDTLIDSNDRGIKNLIDIVSFDDIKSMLNIKER